jgi:hypothetical protein
MARARATGTDRPTGSAGFWYDWNNVTGPAAKKDPERTTGRILLYGIGSDKRLAYEESVLLDICKEYGAVAKASRGLRDQTHFMSSDAIVSNLSGGRFTSVILFESLESSLKTGDIVNRHTKKHIPPIFEDYGTTNWFVSYDMAHIAKQESLRFTTIDHENDLGLLIQDCDKDFAQQGAFPMMPSVSTYGEAWENFPEKERKILKILDPKDIAPS